ncbi:MAG: DUF4340 domain-containing protein [Spirochaetales bacterium]|nr:DUF4340 domain-containing protein [Spirochaetales bacterium]
MAIRKEYIVLGIIILALIGVLIMVNISPGNIYSLPGLSKISRDDVDKIVFEIPERTVTLVKNSANKWEILPGNFPADEQSVDTMLDHLVDTKLEALISEKEVFARYDLDEANRIVAKAYIGEKLVRQINIGKTSNNFSQTYITLTDDPSEQGDTKIYSANGNMRTVFEKDMNDLRNKKICSFDTSEIKELILEFEGQTMVITKQEKQPDVTEEGEQAPPPEEVWTANTKEKPIPQNTINDILNTMSDLSCEAFIDDKEKSDMTGQFKYKITARGTKDYVLTIWDQTDDNKYPAISSENDYPFLLIGWRAQRMMKTFDDVE